MQKLFSCCLALVLVLFPLFPPQVRAQEADPRYQEKLKEIEELKSKISQLQGQAQTLSTAITYINSKKALTQKQVEATEVEIEILKADIISLNGKIDVLEGSLNSLITTLMTEARQGYKQQNINSFDLMFATRDFSEMLTTYKYLQVAQDHHQNLLKKTTQAKLAYDDQKVAKEKKQETVVALQKKLAQQQQDLIVQEQQKQQLLKDTKNSESNYQKQLAQAQAELASFRAFTKSKTGGMLPPQNSPDGWYFSQRDERWGGVNIGSSNSDNIYDVGCLVSSVAMVMKKYGENVTPLSIAVNTSYFVFGTGGMKRPWPAPSGYAYEYIGRDMGKIDSELSEGRPVIVKLSVRTNVVGTHFIVLKSGSNGDYTMHDPWEGYDKKFTSYYSTNQIISVGYLKKM